MKKKFLKVEKFQENLEPEERLSFGTESPFSPITLPPKTIFAAWHGNYFMSGAQGTMYVCRVDFKDLLPLNFDVYSFIPQEGDEKQLKIVYQRPKSIEFHWAQDVPSFIKKQMPKWVRNKIRKFLNPAS